MKIYAICYRKTIQNQLNSKVSAASQQIAETKDTGCYDEINKWFFPIRESA